MEYRRESRYLRRQMIYKTTTAYVRGMYDYVSEVLWFFGMLWRAWPHAYRTVRNEIKKNSQKGGAE